MTLLLAGIAPVAAAPGGSTGSSAALAEHVEDCNLTVDAEGTLFLDGVALAGLELAAVHTLLADADLDDAVRLASEADAEVCLNLELIGDGEPVATINGHVDVCGNLTLDGQGNLVINGVVIEADLLASELGALLDAAAVAGLTLCASITVNDNVVSVDVIAEACATVTLNDDDTVTISFGDSEFDLPAASVDGSAELEVGVGVEVGIVIVGSLDLDTDEVSVVAVIDAAACTDSRLILIKDVTGTGFDTDELFNFSIGVGAFQLGIDDSVDGEYEPGNYSILESLTAAQMAAGWSFVDAECDDDSLVPDLAGTGVNVSLQAGETITCVFTNNFVAVAAPSPSMGTGPAATVAPLLPDTAGSSTPVATGTILAALIALTALAVVTLMRVAVARDR